MPEAILVSGGNLPWQTGSEPEAELTAGLLVELGVTCDAIGPLEKPRRKDGDLIHSAH
jgi:hypothetical protein